MPKYSVLGDVSLGILTADRYDRLVSLLMSMPMLPYRCGISILDNSKEPIVLETTPYLQFLESVGFKVRITRVPAGTNMFALRHLLLSTCTTRFLWMLDDDVALVDNPLQPFLEQVAWFYQYERHFGYLQGSKVDIINTEGYSDWAIRQEEVQFASGGIPKWFYTYDLLSCSKLQYQTCVADCGNIFIDVEKAIDVGGFRLDLPNEQLAGLTSEDVLFGGRLASKYSCYYIPQSVVFHFPKEKMRFKTKDPRWLFELGYEKIRISGFIKDKLNAFYESKFGPKS